MPKDFAGVQAFHQIAWPLSHLADVAKYIFQQQFTALEVADVPHKWKEDTADNNKRKANEQGSRTTGGPPQWQSSGGYGPLASGSQGTPSQNGAPMSHDRAPDNIRSRIGGLVEECKRLCGTFQF